MCDNSPMSDTLSPFFKDVPLFSNDKGEKELYVQVRTFGCKGVQEPFDHPHVYLTLGQQNFLVCPYCSTKFIYKNPHTSEVQ